MRKKYNTQNLTPFKKGNPGGPGRKPKLPALDILLSEVLGEEKDGISAAKAILMALRQKAAKGDVRAAEVLMDRAWGKAKQTIEATGADGAALFASQTTVIIERRGKDSAK